MGLDWDGDGDDDIIQDGAAAVPVDEDVNGDAGGADKVCLMFIPDVKRGVVDPVGPAGGAYDDDEDDEGEGREGAVYPPPAPAPADDDDEGGLGDDDNDRDDDPGDDENIVVLLVTPLLVTDFDVRLAFPVESREGSWKLSSSSDEPIKLHPPLLVVPLPPPLLRYRE